MKKRNYGIDLLRIISMFYVVILHCIGHGGLDSAEMDAPHGWAVFSMQIFAYCAVDCFALISGYVGYRENNNRLKIAGYISMWLEVVFYGLLLNVIFQMIMPGSVRLEHYVHAVLPVTNNTYWYFTMYTGLCLLAPLLNWIVRKLDAKKLHVIVVLLIVFGAFYRPFSKVFADVLWIDDGYSVLWLAIIYFIGAVMKKTQLFMGIDVKKGVLAVFLLTFFGVLWKLYIDVLLYPILGESKVSSLFVSYLSPTVVMAAILHLAIFARLELPAKLENFVKFASPGAFSVYLINEHAHVRKYIMTDTFIWLTDAPVIYSVIVVIGFAVLFALGSVVIDHFRQMLFKKVRIDRMSKMIEQKIYGIFGRIVKRR